MPTTRNTYLLNGEKFLLNVFYIGKLLDLQVNEFWQREYEIRLFMVCEGASDSQDVDEEPLTSRGSFDFQVVVSLTLLYFIRLQDTEVGLYQTRTSLEIIIMSLSLSLSWLVIKNGNNPSFHFHKPGHFHIATDLYIWDVARNNNN